MFWSHPPSLDVDCQVIRVYNRTLPILMPEAPCNRYPIYLKARRGWVQLA